MPFLVALDPDFKTSLQVATQLSQEGDFLEIGFPYSDPLADGPTIQAADNRALKNGATASSVLSMIKALREKTKIPITVLVYVNLVLQAGIDKFYKKAVESGVDGVLIPDAPIEEIAPFAQAAKKYGLQQIFLVAQTTDNQRLKKILQHAQGFLYLVSVLGVTGARQKFGHETQKFIKRIRQQTDLPLCVGFGVSTPAQFKVMIQAGADGVIVGSAIVDVIAKNLGKKDMVDKVGGFAKQFRS